MSSWSRKRDATKFASKVDELRVFHYQLSLLAFDPRDCNVLNVHESINYQLEFDKSNFYEATQFDIIDMPPSEALEIVVDEVIDDVVEEVVGFAVVQGALDFMKKFLN